MVKMDFLFHIFYINYQVELVCKRRQSFAQVIHWRSATRINEQYSEKCKIEFKLMHGVTINSHLFRFDCDSEFISAHSLRTENKFRLTTFMKFHWNGMEFYFFFYSLLSTNCNDIHIKNFNIQQFVDKKNYLLMKAIISQFNIQKTLTYLVLGHLMII